MAVQISYVVMTTGIFKGYPMEIHEEPFMSKLHLFFFMLLLRLGTWYTSKYMCCLSCNQY
uniref:Uncharacterized protein n=1 Tax=Arundo donax TaxID=35708 RepID=A0A0A9FSG1_ARUDO